MQQNYADGYSWAIDRLRNAVYTTQAILFAMNQPHMGTTYQDRKFKEGVEKACEDFEGSSVYKATVKQANGSGDHGDSMDGE